MPKLRVATAAPIPNDSLARARTVHFPGGAGIGIRLVDQAKISSRAGEQAPFAAKVGKFKANADGTPGAAESSGHVNINDVVAFVDSESVRGMAFKAVVKRIKACSQRLNPVNGNPMGFDLAFVAMPSSAAAAASASVEKLAEEKNYAAAAAMSPAKTKKKAKVKRKAKRAAAGDSAGEGASFVGWITDVRIADTSSSDDGADEEEAAAVVAATADSQTPRAAKDAYTIKSAFWRPSSSDPNAGQRDSIVEVQRHVADFIWLQAQLKAQFAFVKDALADDAARGDRALVPRVLKSKGTRSLARQLALWLEWIAKHPVVSRSSFVHLFLRSKTVLLGEALTGWRLRERTSPHLPEPPPAPMLALDVWSNPMESEWMKYELPEAKERAGKLHQMALCGSNKLGALLSRRSNAATGLSGFSDAVTGLATAEECEPAPSTPMPSFLSRYSSSSVATTTAVTVVEKPAVHKMLLAIAAASQETSRRERMGIDTMQALYERLRFWGGAGLRVQSSAFLQLDKLVQRSSSGSPQKRKGGRTPLKLSKAERGALSEDQALFEETALNEWQWTMGSRVGSPVSNERVRASFLAAAQKQLKHVRATRKAWVKMQRHIVRACEKQLAIDQQRQANALAAQQISWAEQLALLEKQQIENAESSGVIIHTGGAGRGDEKSVVLGAWSITSARVMGHELVGTGRERHAEFSIAVFAKVEWWLRKGPYAARSGEEEEDDESSPVRQNFEHEWMATKRYSEFKQLGQDVKAEVSGSSSLPALCFRTLPEFKKDGWSLGKLGGLIGGNKEHDPVFLEKRRAKLGSFLDALIEHGERWSLMGSESLVDFMNATEERISAIGAITSSLDTSKRSGESKKGGKGKSSSKKKKKKRRAAAAAAVVVTAAAATSSSRPSKTAAPIAADADALAHATMRRPMIPENNRTPSSRSRKAKAKPRARTKTNIAPKATKVAAKAPRRTSLKTKTKVEVAVADEDMTEEEMMNQYLENRKKAAEEKAADRLLAKSRRDSDIKRNKMTRQEALRKKREDARKRPSSGGPSRQRAHGGTRAGHAKVNLSKREAAELLARQQREQQAGAELAEKRRLMEIERHQMERQRVESERALHQRREQERARNEESARQRVLQKESEREQARHEAKLKQQRRAAAETGHSSVAAADAASVRGRGTGSGSFTRGRSTSSTATAAAAAGPSQQAPAQQQTSASSSSSAAAKQKHIGGGWVEVATTDGTNRIYYYHAKTRVTRWDRPGAEVIERMEREEEETKRKQQKRVAVSRLPLLVFLLPSIHFVVCVNSALTFPLALPPSRPPNMQAMHAADVEREKEADETDQISSRIKKRVGEWADGKTLLQMLKVCSLVFSFLPPFRIYEKQSLTRFHVCSFSSFLPSRV